MGKINKFIKNPWKLFSVFAFMGWFNDMSDEKYLSLLYKAELGRELNLEQPASYNEKLNWLKLNDRRPIYTTMVDKLEAKKYISNTLGEDLVVPVYKVWDSVDEMDIEDLPEQFVLKTNHDSGGYVICRDKETFDIEKAKKKLDKSMKRNYYYTAREWPYKCVKKHVFAEKFLDMGDALVDYKVMCFNGKPQIIQLNYVSNSRHSQDFYDTNWNILPISQEFYAPLSKVNNPKPVFLQEMLEKSTILAKDTFFLRVDWFEAEGKLYSGELTFYDGAGIMPFDNYDMDLKIGELLELPIE